MGRRGCHFGQGSQLDEGSKALLPGLNYMILHSSPPGIKGIFTGLFKTLIMLIFHYDGIDTNKVYLEGITGPNNTIKPPSRAFATKHKFLK